LEELEPNEECALHHPSVTAEVPALTARCIWVPLLLLSSYSASTAIAIIITTK
jgi:hypothetical protein